MNYKQLSNKLKALELIKFQSKSGSKLNLFQYCPNNSDAHEDLKFRVFKDLRKRGFEVYVEPEFSRDKYRPDLVSFDDKGNGYIIEIVCSETQISKKKKIDKYSMLFELIFIDVLKPYELPI